MGLDSLIDIVHRASGFLGWEGSIGNRARRFRTAGVSRTRRKRNEGLKARPPSCRERFKSSTKLGTADCVLTNLAVCYCMMKRVFHGGPVLFGNPFPIHLYSAD